MPMVVAMTFRRSGTDIAGAPVTFATTPANATKPRPPRPPATGRPVWTPFRRVAVAAVRASGEQCIVVRKECGNVSQAARSA